MTKAAPCLSFQKAFAALSLPGARMMKMHTLHDGEQFFVLPGGRVTATDAAMIMSRANVEVFDDGLFRGCTQSWRIATN